MTQNNQTMEFRLAHISEQVELEEFLVKIFSEELRALAKNYIRSMFSGDYRKPTFLLGRLNGQTIAAASYQEELFTTETWGIGWVSVDQDYRNQGIGQKLVENCLKKISQQVSTPISVILRTDQDKISLYAKNGFTVMGGDYSGGVYMIKAQSPATLYN